MASNVLQRVESDEMAEAMKLATSTQRPVPELHLDSHKAMYKEGALYADHARRFESALERYQKHANGERPLAAFLGSCTF